MRRNPRTTALWRQLAEEIRRIGEEPGDDGESNITSTIRNLWGIARGGPAREAIRAAELLWEHGWGKVPQSIGIVQLRTEIVAMAKELGLSEDEVLSDGIIQGLLSPPSRQPNGRGSQGASDPALEGLSAEEQT